jgi:hypothetical protein
VTEQQCLHALLLLSAMEETLKKLERDFAELKRAAEQFRADIGGLDHATS